MADVQNDETNCPDPYDYWPFPDDLDEYERGFSESMARYRILPDPNFEETRKRVEAMARRTLAKKHPGRMTEEQRRKLPPGLLAYWRGEAPTPYADPTGWDEFRKTLTPSNDLWRLVPIDSATDDDPSDQTDATAPPDDS